MTNQEPPDQRDEQSTVGPSWLQRQWQRVRQLNRRDVIIGQVGAGATNVVIGKNNVQINVGGRNLTLPIYAIALLLLILLGFALYPLVEPIWWPSQMTGTYRIAIANFGEVDEWGHVQATDRGRVVSKWFFDNLSSEYASTTMDVAQSIQLWHDLDPASDKNVTFGVIEGEQAAAREAAAAALAERIGAHMVIYGHLVAAGEQRPPRLDLAFYLAPRVNVETSEIVGPHRLSKPLPLPATFDVESPDANAAVSALLKVRTDAFFWLTLALTLDIQGRSSEALTTLRQAERALERWSEDDGKEILYFFIGREELFLDNAIQAEQELLHALELNPTYARAQVALGSARLKQARAQPPTTRLTAPSLLLQALADHRRGLELAADAGDPLVINLANLALAKSYRLLGETYYHLGQVAEARRFFALTRAKIEPLLEPLRVAGQYRLLAQAYEAQGAAYLQEADLLRPTEPATARTLLEAAATVYASCMEQGWQVVDEILTNEVIGEGCQRYAALTATYLEELGGE